MAVSSLVIRVPPARPQLFRTPYIVVRSPRPLHVNATAARALGCEVECSAFPAETLPGTEWVYEVYMQPPRAVPFTLQRCLMHLPPYGNPLVRFTYQPKNAPTISVTIFADCNT